MAADATLEPGALVWAQYDAYRPWPAQVTTKRRPSKYRACVPVLFINGSGNTSAEDEAEAEFAWVPASRVYPIDVSSLATSVSCDDAADLAAFQAAVTALLVHTPWLACPHCAGLWLGSAPLAEHVRRMHAAPPYFGAPAAPLSSRPPLLLLSPSLAQSARDQWLSRAAAAAADAVPPWLASAVAMAAAKTPAVDAVPEVAFSHPDDHGATSSPLSPSSSCATAAAAMATAAAGEEPEVFPCAVCGREFPTPAARFGHSRIHRAGVTSSSGPARVAVAKATAYNNNINGINGIGVLADVACSVAMMMMARPAVVSPPPILRLSDFLPLTPLTPSSTAQHSIGGGAGRVSSDSDASPPLVTLCLEATARLLTPDREIGPAALLPFRMSPNSAFSPIFPRKRPFEQELM